MAKTVTEIHPQTGKVVTYKAKKIKEVDFPVTIVDTKAKRIARALWG